MNGLINRAIECFVRDSYGETVWQEVTAASASTRPRSSR